MNIRGLLDDTKVPRVRMDSDKAGFYIAVGSRKFRTVEAYNQTVKDVAMCLLVDHRLERNLAINLVHNAMERKRNTLSIAFFVNLRREIEEVSGEKELT